MSTDLAKLQQAHGANDGDTELTSKPSISTAPAEVEVSLPTQPVVSLESVAVAYVIVLNSLAETLFERTKPAAGDNDAVATTRRRREICAAVWAANCAALVASKLSADERTLMTQLVWRRMVQHWKSLCESDEGESAWLESRSAEYLHAQALAHPVKTASHIVNMLIESIGTDQDGRSNYSRVLSSLVGHRIISQVNHLNELKARFRFV